MTSRLSSTKLDLSIAAGLALMGALTRAPYLALIPDFQDEVMQTVYALSIQPGKFMPWVGNDSYAGALFSYMIAICLRVFGSTPVAPRIVAMCLGALTVGLTWLLARALGLDRRWATLAGLLMAANPHHIVVASHYAGSSYVVPFFTTAFLAALSLAVRLGSGPGLVAAGVLLGMAFQTTPVPALMAPGVLIWFVSRARPEISLRTRWPYLAAIALILIYSPVIAYNLQNQWVGVAIAQNRAYALQPDLSLPAYVHNLSRLLLQLGRQIGGVLAGGESLRDLAGLPLVMSAWALVGMVFAARRGLDLPLLAVGSQVLVMPWLSSYFWEIHATRFTNQLTPLIVIAMSALVAGLWASVRSRIRSRNSVNAVAVAAGILCAALSLSPLVPLWRYYGDLTARGQTNAHYYPFFDELVRQSRGATVLISDSIGSFNLPEYFIAVNRVPYTLLPIGRMMERLTTGQETGRVILVLSPDDQGYVQSQADQAAWSVLPRQTTLQKPWYGLYTVVQGPVRMPAFVLGDGVSLPPAVRLVQADLAGQLGMVAYEPKADRLSPGDRFAVALYWKAIGAVAEDYIGFMHLIGPDGRLVAQDDHELGRGFYRSNFWRPDQVIRERYELTLPGDIPPGDYRLAAGAYSFPSLERLAVRSASAPAQDNVVTLGTVHVGP